MDLIEELAPRGPRRIALLTGAGSMRNQTFYRRRGYVETERSPGGSPVVHVVHHGASGGLNS